jgi:16S rRNA (guanine527-N7)-methyltransferase
MSDSEAGAIEKLNSLLASGGQAELTVDEGQSFAVYLALLLRWNAKVNLTAIRDVDGILQRHFVESIACARLLPAGIGTLLDLGSGAGFPGLGIAICRPEVEVTLAESQGKKAAFLSEAVRVLGVGARVRVHGGRAELLNTRFDCVTMRAVDRMGDAVRVAATLVRAGGWLAPMTTGGEVTALREIAGPGFEWSEAVALPGGVSRVVAFGRRAAVEG